MSRHFQLTLKKKIKIRENIYLVYKVFLEKTILILKIFLNFFYLKNIFSFLHEMSKNPCISSMMLTYSDVNFTRNLIN